MRGFLEQVLFAADECPNGSDQLLSDGVQRRVSDLGEQLLEVVVEQLVLIGEHGQRSIITHGTDGFCAVLRHDRSKHPNLFDAVAKRLLQPHELKRIHGRSFRRGRQVVERQFVFFQPLAVGVLAGQFLFQFIVADDPAFFQANQEHAARLQSSLEFDIGGGHFQYAGFRSHH